MTFNSDEDEAMVIGEDRRKRRRRGRERAGRERRGQFLVS